MKLTDLEIIRKIADIEDIHYMETKYSDRDNFLGLVGAPDGSGTPPELIGEYNPLTDGALCFRLMVKYDLDVIAPYRKNNETTWEAQIFSKDYADAFQVYDKSLNRAICLAIIEANK